VSVELVLLLVLLSVLVNPTQDQLHWML